MYTHAVTAMAKFVAGHLYEKTRDEKEETKIVHRKTTIRINKEEEESDNLSISQKS
jgi:hypothetical protein